MRDISQACAQSTTDVAKPTYSRPPPELGLSDDYVLAVLRPLYGLPEAGLQWFLSYSNFHVDDVHMQLTSLDSCLMFKRSGKELEAL